MKAKGIKDSGKSTMKAKDIIELGQSIGKCSNLKGLKFIYNLAQNSKLIKEFEETFNQERMKLIDEMCEKDEKGENIVVKGVFKLKDMDAYSKEYNLLLEKDIDIELHKIKEDEVPEDISSGQLIGIYPLIILN